MVVVAPLFVFDPVDEEVDGTVEGGEEMTQTGDNLHPVWPQLRLSSQIIELNISWGKSEVVISYYENDLLPR